MEELDLDKMNNEAEEYNQYLDVEIQKKFELIDIISKKQSLLALELERIERLLNEK